MDEFYEKVKKGATKLKDETEKVVKNIAKTSSGMIEQTKLRIAVNDAESKKKQLLCEIGEYVFAQHMEGAEFVDEVGDKCNQIDLINEDIEEIKRQIAEIKDSVVCPSCGEYNNVSYEYCYQCGYHLKKN